MEGRVCSAEVSGTAVWGGGVCGAYGGIGVFVIAIYGIWWHWYIHYCYIWHMVALVYSLLLYMAYGGIGVFIIAIYGI